MSTLKERVAEASTCVVVNGKPVKNLKKAEKLILDKLTILGIFLDDDISLEMLESGEVKEGDARAVFCESEPIMPVPRFRRLWSILCSNGQENNKHIDVAQNKLSTEGVCSDMEIGDVNHFVKKLKPVGQCSNKELLQLYSEDDENTFVEEELIKRSKGASVIVFDDDKNINVTVSSKLFSMAKKGLRIPSYYKDRDGKGYFTYMVGQFPEEWYETCPVTGEILFDGHYSESISFSWEKFSLEQKQIIWIMKDQGVFDGVDSPMVLRNLLRTVVSSSVDDMIESCPEIAPIYQELKELNQLPTLKTKISSTSQLRDRKVSDPFNS